MLPYLYIPGKYTYRRGQIFFISGYVERLTDINLELELAIDKKLGACDSLVK